MRLSSNEERMIMSYFDTLPACDEQKDGRTDGQTDRQTDISIVDIVQHSTLC